MQFPSLLVELCTVLSAFEMDHPRCQISHVIKSLTEGSPAEQKQTLESYFLPDSSFTHPFCRIPRFSRNHVPFLGDINSRWVIWIIYRWYRILSPKIVLEVQSIVFDESLRVLYVEIQQVFCPFFLPFYKSNVHLTTKLRLYQSPHNGNYYVFSQEDLYQTNEFVKFFWPSGATILYLWQISATMVCVIGSLLLFWVTRTQQWNANRINGIEKDM
ncbi:hypothetical protein B0O99DRAFT_377588 [Bisporella sp. PMI_857]|nr:hypothetical protein B0O99DRAFT_377588 [Bisporella sp. PMI_857]